MSALQTLPRESIDYAGLFPPAELDMGQAVANYASYRNGRHAWALGRFVVPAFRLAEFEEAAAGLLSPRRWRLAVLLGTDPLHDFETIGEFNCLHVADGAGIATVDVVEAKADSPEAVEQLLAHVPSDLQPYIEI